MLRAALAIVALAAPAAALAQFRSIAEPAAVLYDAPSTRATKLYVASRNLPVEVIATDGAWVKVRDPFGGLSWVERKQLGERRTVIVSAPVADIRQRPEEAAPLAFQAQSGVVLDLLEGGAAGWARVRHADGTEGFVRVAQVWGVQ
jgi:SH3-like domain-containing protein